MPQEPTIPANSSCPVGPKKTYFSITVLLLLTVSFARAQFSCSTSQLENLGVILSNPIDSYGSGISFYDFNYDGWDDLTIAAGNAPIVFLQNNGGTFEPAPFTIPTSTIGYTQSVLWQDFDNDGDADFFVTRDNGPVELWENDGDFNFTNIAPTSGIMQGFYKFTYSAWGDYNHDGFLDLFLTIYHPPSSNTLYSNRLYRNNGDGTFTDVTFEAGVLLTPRTTFQPVFIDVNNDGWEDIFLAVDRAPFPNELFINNQDGTFDHVTATAGVHHHIDAMSAAVSDYNNDQDLDIYVTNSPIQTGNLLYSNNGDTTYTDVGVEQHANLMINSWGATWIDHDNNTWDDLFIGHITNGQTGPSLLINQNGEFFSAAENTGFSDSEDSFNCARGDFNNDGYFDIAVSNRSPFTHQLYQNNGGENNFISITLEGTLANRDGIGTWLHCYVGDSKLSKYTLNSENLGGQNSTKNIFGLGPMTQVDSLVLEWNSGTKEVYLNPEINTQHHFKEGATFTTPFSISHEDDLFLCPGESVELHAGDFEGYLWSTGDTTQSITVSESGIYTVDGWNNFGLTATSFPVEVIVAPENETIAEITPISCAGEQDGAVEVALLTGEIDSIWWNTGSFGNFIDSLSPGLYQFAVTDTFGCTYNGEAVIIEPAPLFGNLMSRDADCFGQATGNAVASILGGSPPYATDWFGFDPEALSAGAYSLQITDAHGCIINLEFSIEQPDSLALEVLVQLNDDTGDASAALSIIGGTPPYSVSWSTGQTDTYNISLTQSGVYEVYVSDSLGCAATAVFEVDIQTGVISHEWQSQPLIYPNPNTGRFRIEDCPAPEFEIQIIDVWGRLVTSPTTVFCNQDISFEHLAPGNYVVAITHRNIQTYCRLFVRE